MFITKCPRCNDEDQLEVTSGIFMANGLRLCSDGFAFSEARGIDTEDEVVTCRECESQFDLTDLTFNDDEPPSDEVRLKIKSKE